ncbi:unnamed protein product [Urochloa decumbens]|uniref:Uncharacterized protein n=1 Tax=Urochloa decumbens TaxID=240449 RepID=A0ABC8Z7F7_9POAL
METIIRRCRGFVNIVAENYDKSGLYYSVHRLDVSKHLFFPSTIHAHYNNTTGGGMIEERLQELPTPCIGIQPTLVESSKMKMAFFGLLSPSSSESRILCINEAGHSLLYDADERMNYKMPSLEGFKGPVSVSLSIAQAAGAKEEGIFGTTGCWRFPRVWYWQSLPPPPFVCRPGGGLISAYTMMEGGRTICLSSAADGVGSYFFETVRGEWSRAGDWVLPFTGRAQYVADLNLWLGFSLQYPHDLCATNLHALATNQQPPTTLLPAREWMATKMNLLNLGSGRFVIAKFCKVIRNIGESDMVEDAEDEFLVLTGMEIRPSSRSTDVPA